MTVSEQPTLCEHCGSPLGPYLKRFCCIDCRKAAGLPPRGAVCKHCAAPFMSKRNTAKAKWPEYCSHECYLKVKRTKVPLVCVGCGADFKNYKDQKYCSIECTRTNHIRDRVSGWTGGVVLQNNRVSRRIDREGYKHKYDGEHRLAAERAIGRRLVRGESVLCLDFNHNNWDARNLFIVPNATERGRLTSGGAVWPSEGNLQRYATQGYAPPPTRVVIHEWVNGKRFGKGKRLIHRHPHADEIIKRCEAGASVTELAEAFDNSKKQIWRALKANL